VDQSAQGWQAIYDWLPQQPTLCAFLDDARFAISSAHVERLLRVVSTVTALDPRPRPRELLPGPFAAAAPWVQRQNDDPNFVHCPSETTSTEPSTTLIAVCSSIA
jgi:hypothetical protein